MPARTLFLSDLHLGTRACKVEYLTACLEQVTPEHLYIIGDGIDVQRLKKRWYWPPSHAAVVRRLVALARQGTEVTYIPGNHDDALRQYAGNEIGGVRLALHAVHPLVDGRRILLMHGDEFDFVVRHQRLLSGVAAVLYGQLLLVNRVVDRLRRSAGLDYWSFARSIKERQSRVLEMVARFKQALCRHARAVGCDGVMAGHIHVAGVDHCDGVFYGNPGDWVESCTALAEDHRGRVTVVDWAGQERIPTRTAARRLAAAEGARLAGVAAY
ncbi:MAG: UDP-2,3-diacylglucosamine diphosphatase [Candidatus Latescibacterota bacterium]|jgi:UDP-2,3-diacylglucosamine pyrophosphatase LpxH